MSLARIHVIISALILAGSAVAARPAIEPVTLNDDLESLSIGRRIEYVEDPGGAMTIDDVRTRGRSWNTSDNESINFGFSNSAYWFRFQVIDSRKEKQRCYLEINYPMLDFIEFYGPANDGAAAPVRTGDHYPFYTRKIIDRNFIFDVIPGPGPGTCYFRIATSSSINFSPIIWSEKGFQQRNSIEIPLTFMFYGFTVVMALFNLLIFLSARNISYIHYSISIISFMLFMLTLNGYAFQYLWPNAIWWANNCLPFFMCATLSLTAVFIRSHINLPKFFPGINRLAVYGLILPATAWAFISLAVSYQPAIVAATAITGFVAVVTYTLGIYVSIRGSRPGRFATFGYTFLAFGVLSYVLKTFGVLPSNALTTWSIQTGYAMLVILLSLSLADEINTAKKDLQDLNLNLENKVDERTNELRTIMGVLNETNDNLMRFNIEMEDANARYVKDMDMAVSVQSAFLHAKPPQSGEYDIAVEYRPMSGVSGDFYDFYRRGDSLLGVGVFDVSGHGISSALLTLLARSLIEKNFWNLKDRDLGSVMDTINMELIDEIGQSGYYITGILLRFNGGSFEYANSGHPELVRKRGGTAEAVRPAGGESIVGPFLGIELLKEKFRSLTIDVNPGDTLLIYTDSLSETRNAQEKPFGESGITRSMLEAPDGSAREILDHVMERFYAFTGKREGLNDDITAMVIKRR